MQAQLNISVMSYCGIVLLHHYKLFFTFSSYILVSLVADFWMSFNRLLSTHFSYDRYTYSNAFGKSRLVGELHPQRKEDQSSAGGGPTSSGRRTSPAAGGGSGNQRKFIWGATFAQLLRTGDIRRTSFVEYKEELGSGILHNIACSYTVAVSKLNISSGE